MFAKLKALTRASELITPIIFMLSIIAIVLDCPINYEQNIEPTTVGAHF